MVINYKAYALEYLNVIKSINDNKYYILTYKNSKFLFYWFNNHFGSNERPLQRLGYTITLENELGLLQLQRENWQYFVEKILSIMEDPNFKIDDEADLEKDLITNFPENVKTCKNSAGILINFVQFLLKNWFWVAVRIL